jgi:uncharacterized protein YndB with AHSA1/START domain
MEYGTIEREMHIKASPDTVFEVISSPEHLMEWWPDEAELEPTPGSQGHVTFGDPTSPDANVVNVTVVDAVPGRLFSFRWTHPDDEPARPGNSMLVTFELTPDAGGTRLRMTETGFREMGWEVAVLEAQYNDHASGWTHFLSQLADYAPTVGASA